MKRLESMVFRWTMYIRSVMRRTKQGRFCGDWDEERVGECLDGKHDLLELVKFRSNLHS